MRPEHEQKARRILADLHDGVTVNDVSREVGVIARAIAEAERAGAERSHADAIARARAEGAHDMRQRVIERCMMGSASYETEANRNHLAESDVDWHFLMGGATALRLIAEELREYTAPETRLAAPAPDEGDDVLAADSARRRQEAAARGECWLCNSTGLVRGGPMEPPTEPCPDCDGTGKPAPDEGAEKAEAVMSRSMAKRIAVQRGEDPMEALRAWRSSLEAEMRAQLDEGAEKGEVQRCSTCCGGCDEGAEDCPDCGGTGEKPTPRILRAGERVEDDR